MSLFCAAFLNSSCRVSELCVGALTGAALWRRAVLGVSAAHGRSALAANHGVLLKASPSSELPEENENPILVLPQ